MKAGFVFLLLTLVSTAHTLKASDSSQESLKAGPTCFDQYSSPIDPDLAQYALQEHGITTEQVVAISENPGQLEHLEAILRLSRFVSQTSQSKWDALSEALDNHKFSTPISRLSPRSIGNLIHQKRFQSPLDRLRYPREMLIRHVLGGDIPADILQQFTDIFVTFPTFQERTPKFDAAFAQYVYRSLRFSSDQQYAFQAEVHKYVPGGISPSATNSRTVRAVGSRNLESFAVNIANIIEKMRKTYYVFVSAGEFYHALKTPKNAARITKMGLSAWRMKPSIVSYNIGVKIVNSLLSLDHLQVTYSGKRIKGIFYRHILKALVNLIHSIPPTESADGKDGTIEALISQLEISETESKQSPPKQNPPKVRSRKGKNIKSKGKPTLQGKPKDGSTDLLKDRVQEITKRVESLSRNKKLEHLSRFAWTKASRSDLKRVFGKSQKNELNYFLTVLKRIEASGSTEGITAVSSTKADSVLEIKHSSTIRVSFMMLNNKPHVLAAIGNAKGSGSGNTQTRFLQQSLRRVTEF